jgi:hypothetical protein
MNLMMMMMNALKEDWNCKYIYKKSDLTSTIFSNSQPDDGPVESKHLAVLILHEVVFDGYLFIPYFIVQHNGMHNFAIKKYINKSYCGQCRQFR